MSITKPESGGIFPALVRINCLLFAVVLTFLPVHQASAGFLVELHKYDNPATSITNRSEADTLIGTADTLRSSTNWSVIDFDDFEDATTGHYAVNNPWTGFISTKFAVRITAEFSTSAAKAGDYTFAINHDDGFRLLIDGMSVAEFDGTIAIGNI